MATLKVKFRESSVPGKPGTIFYQVIHEKKTIQIATRLHPFPEQWDSITERPITSDIENKKNLTYIHRVIDADTALLDNIIRELEQTGARYTVHDIADRFRSPQCQMYVLTFFKEQITFLSMSNRLGTARNYLRTMNSFSSFLHGDDIPFKLLTEELVFEYAEWLQLKGVKRNSSSFYMRVLRSIYNKAVRKHFAQQTFPFQNVYTGVDKTQKRAINEEVILQLYQMKISSPSLALARDLFIFSYCMRGMAFVDMAFLRHKNIRGGFIHYTRRKTGQQLSVHIEPCIQEIIDRYSSQTEQTPYLLPILTSEDPVRAFSQYQTALGYYNRQLKQLSQMLRLDISLSSYCARHSWATAARNHNIPLSVISAGMGHTSERTTQIYLASLENSVIDRANQNIIAFLKSV